MENPSRLLRLDETLLDLPGLNVPMTSDLAGEQIGGWRQYTHSATTSAWLAQHFYLHWKYSADRRFLEARAYPYLRDAAVFIEAVTALKRTGGFRSLPLSASPEINDNTPGAWFDSITNFDLALIRWLLAASAELAGELKQPADAGRWRKVLSEMPEFEYGEDGRLLVAKNYPLPASHRHFSHLMAIHPLGLIDWSGGEPARRTIRASLAELRAKGSDWWCGYSFSWLGNLAARARDAAAAEKALEIFSTAFTLRNSFHCNGDQSGKGYSKFTYRPFTLEGNFAAASGVQEMLLQSHTGSSKSSRRPGWLEGRVLHLAPRPGRLSDFGRAPRWRRDPVGGCLGKGRNAAPGLPVQWQAAFDPHVAGAAPDSRERPVA